MRPSSATAARAAREVDSRSDQLLAAGHADLIALAQEAGVAEDELGWDQTAPQQLAWAVEIGQHEVEQLGALDDAELDSGPLFAREQHRNRIEAPGRAGGVKPAVLIGLTVGVAIDLAIDLRTVLIVGPLMNLVIADGVEEGPQRARSRALVPYRRRRESARPQAGGRRATRV